MREVPRISDQPNNALKDFSEQTHSITDPPPYLPVIFYFPIVIQLGIFVQTQLFFFLKDIIFGVLWSKQFTKLH